MAPAARKAVEFTSARHFRARLVLSTLARKPIIIRDIRPAEAAATTTAAAAATVGLASHEASFLRLLDKLTSGARIDVNRSGTVLRYTPGVLVGGADIAHDCAGLLPARSVTYLLEPLLMLAPFCKERVGVLFSNCVTDGAEEFESVECFAHASLPLMRALMGDDLAELCAPDDLQVRVESRGAPPRGGGRVRFQCPVLRDALPPFGSANAADAEQKQATTAAGRRRQRPAWLAAPRSVETGGVVKRIRGVAYATRVAPAFTNRLVDAARGSLDRYLRDVYVHTDHARGGTSGASPGYGLSLFAETSRGCVYAVSASTAGAAEGEGEGEGERGAGGVGEQQEPEALARRCVRRLLREVRDGGCVDSTRQSLLLLMMALSPSDVNKACIGRRLTPHAVQLLRDMKRVFGVVFRIEQRRAAGGMENGRDNDRDDDNDNDDDSSSSSSGSSDDVEEEAENGVVNDAGVTEEGMVVASCVGMRFVNFARRRH